MKIFQINSYFQTNKLHLELARALERPSIKQWIFIPLAVGSRESGEEQLKNASTHFDYVFCFKPWHRFVWPYKMLKIWQALKNSFHSFHPDLVHAHTLITNGLFAYLLKKSVGTPFVVTIRGTDTEFFFAKSSLFVKLGLHILRSADAIILLSPAYLDRHLPRYFPYEDFSDIYKKCHVIPNGLAADWKLETDLEKEYNGGVLVFVGKLDRNKNIDLLIDAVRYRERRGKRTSLNVVGDGPELARLRKRADGLNCRFYGRLNEISEIKSVLASSDILVMPSFKETFGLVYAEAMSQGLPVVYTRGQGFDGFFSEGEVGYAVDPRSVKDLDAKLDLITEDYARISARAIFAATSFDWNIISDRIVELYRTATSDCATDHLS